MKIESHDSNIESLLTSNFFFIPTFQRPYSWDDENLDDFWKDVAQSDEDDYFIGSMVLYKSGRQQFGVVDSQQRLTTITILLCVIRDFFLTLGSDDLARGLHQLIERTDRDNRRTFVLRTETSYPYFQDEIQNFNNPELTHEPQQEEIRIKAAYDLFNGRILEIMGSIDGDPQIASKDKIDNKLKRLRNLRDSVLFLKIILVELDNEDDAYLIFETLNTRGKDLSLSDLLKNLFTKLVKGKGDVDVVKELWTRLMSELYNSSAEIDPDVFFTHSWASRFDATTQQKAFKKIKAEINKTNAKAHLDDLVEDSIYYRAIFEPSYLWDKSEKSIAKSLSALQMFKVTQQTPAVLSLVRAYKRKLIKNSKVRDSVHNIENFHFVFTAVTSSRSSGGISAMYSSFGRKLFESEDSNEAGIQIRNLTDRLREKRPSESEFVASFKELSYTTANSKQGALVRYILEKISRHTGLTFSDDFADLTIEHIFPQSQIGEIWTDRVVGQLGNLIFLTSAQNEQLKATAFDRKVEYYKQWDQTVPLFVREQAVWTPEIVALRTQEMAELAYRTVWNI
ncbi:DUF262 domain-containing HNH endonuclease family protein [Mesorhizobium sp. VNQ89]|uniref:DUF262 domain-containing protein n=1 Tax=Mesorhizobium quangtriensis TaxID=3157709 RepID=UPI0032B720A9